MKDKTSPAFPGNGCDGMTLFHYYSGAALQGLCANPSLVKQLDSVDEDALLELAHDLADGLLRLHAQEERLAQARKDRR